MATLSDLFLHQKHEALRKTVFVVLLGQLISFLMALTSFSSSYLAKLGVDAPVTQSFFTYLCLTAVYGSIKLFRRKKMMVPWYYYAPLGFVDVQGNYFCGSKLLFGDFLVIIATLFYAVSNVGEEYCVKQKDLVEVISMLAVFGLVFSICEIALLERQAFESIEWSYSVILGFAGYAAGGFLFYTLVPLLLKLSGATMFNLSALTSDMWAVLIRILLYHEEVGWLYYISFAIVALGLVIYSISEKNCTAMTCLDEHFSDQYQVLAVECAESGGETLVA